MEKLEKLKLLRNKLNMVGIYDMKLDYEEERDQIILIEYSGANKIVHILPDIENIGSNAFYNNKYIEKVVFPCGVRNIGAHAFSKTKIGALKVEFNAGCIKLGAFENCRKLKEVELHNAYYIEVGAFSGNLSLQKVSLCGTKLIQASAFKDCTHLKYFNLGEDLQTIGAEAFKNCNLQRVHIPNSVAQISQGAFSENYWIKPELEFNSKLIDVSYNSFGMNKLNCKVRVPTNLQGKSLVNFIMAGPNKLRFKGLLAENEEKASNIRQALKRYAGLNAVCDDYIIVEEIGKAQD